MHAQVGAIDSIIDTVGTVLALHLLGVQNCYCSALPVSEGTVWTAHGILPVPAPATQRLMIGMLTCPGPKTAKGEVSVIMCCLVIVHHKQHRGS